MSTTEERTRPAAQPTRPTGLVARVAHWSASHRRTVLIGWVVVVLGALAIASAVGTSYSTNFTLPGTEAQRAADLLDKEFPAQAGDTDSIVLRARHGTITDAAVRRKVEPMLARVSHLPHVAGVRSPYGRASGQISRDGKIAFAAVTFDKRANELTKAEVQPVVDVARAADSPTVQVEIGGQAIQVTQQTSLGFTTVIGLIAAIIILLVTFGSALAMGMPIVTALFGLGTGIGLVGVLTHVISMPDISTELATMIGLGVGIDYALFIVTRFRENHHNGDDVQRATINAMDTAGRAVLFAGITVMIALLGMFALGVSFLYGLAIASAIAVLFTMLASLTVLPALLSRFGERIARRGRGGAGQGALWRRWSAVLERRPWAGAIAGLAIMLVLAVPVLSMHLNNSDQGNDPTKQTTRRAYDLLAEGFGKGFNGPLLVVARLPERGDQAALARIGSTLRATPDVATVAPPRVSPQGQTATFTVYPRSSPQDTATTDLVNHLRDDRLPPVQRATNTTLLVGGTTAAAIDFSHVLSSKLPLFIGIVVGLSALLLLIVFRSLVIPVQGAVMNLLSIGASLGVTVAIFQHGWLGGLFGVEPGPIEPWLPVMLFAIVFGLSMDYEVFLVSRIHEEWTKRRDASRAVGDGLASTGRVITAAATIMICVFLSFVLGDERALKLFGLSLASAVFVDAFVVRSLLLPSVLHLLGRTTWKLPRWLDGRLPHLALERERPRRERLEPVLDEA